MTKADIDGLDVRVREAFTAWKKLDEIDVRILEGISLYGARNLSFIAEHLQLPTTTVSYRVRRMLKESILFLRISPYHTNMGLKKVVLFVEAAPGHEETLLECLRVVDFWIYLCRIYGPYEGCGGVWTIPRENVEDFLSFLKSLQSAGVARRVEVTWSTCFHGIPFNGRWFSVEDRVWKYEWKEWIKEVETVEGELPYTLIEPKDWPLNADYEDLLIIKELQHDGRASLIEISKKLGIPLQTIKYHYYQHVLKRGLHEGYQVEIYRFPFPLCELLFFKFEFDEYEKLVKFALSLNDKPFFIYLGKVLGENALIGQAYLPRWEYRRFIRALSTLINRGLLKRYRYFLIDMFQVWRETIPFENFKEGGWDYDNQKYHEEVRKILKERAFPLRTNS